MRVRFRGAVGAGCKGIGVIVCACVCECLCVVNSLSVRLMVTSENFRFWTTTTPPLPVLWCSPQMLNKWFP